VGRLWCRADALLRGAEPKVSIRQAGTVTAPLIARYIDALVKGEKIGGAGLVGTYGLSATRTVDAGFIHTNLLRHGN